MPRIRILDDHLVSQIAAGEIVERPASVVKELVENAVDAGARSVRVELEAGGKRRIRVVDDGSGMGKDDALLAFDRHATSKIGSVEDLQRVASLGFRGEALASIAAVARVELATAEEPGEGHRVRIEGGRIRGVEPVAHPRGTSIEVASLFFNVPARRKFLKGTPTELRRALEVVQAYALAWPEVQLTFVHGERTLLETEPGEAGPEGRRERVAQLFGRELADALVPIQEPSGPGGIDGWIGAPASLQGPRRLFVFVNRRLIRDRAVLATFYRAVREEWKSDAYPPLFLFLELAPEEVDVNVHPQKAEVRFRDHSFLRHLEAVLRGALARARGEEPAPLAEIGEPPAGPLAWQGLGGRQARPGSVSGGEVHEGGLGAMPAGEGARLAEAVYAPLDRPRVPLSGRSGERRSFRLLGQYKGTLIVLEGPDGLYLIDQHVAHERILYERLRLQLAGDAPASQGFLEPHLIEVGAAEGATLEALAPQLGGYGFELTPLSGRSFALRAAPAGLQPGQAVALLLELAGRDEAEQGGVEDLASRLVDALAASLACKAAVKMHHPLGPDEMESLVAELFRAEQPYACPHGRPIVLKMGDADLERRFGRR